jgi:acid phosphatase
MKARASAALAALKQTRRTKLPSVLAMLAATLLAGCTAVGQHSAGASEMSPSAPQQTVSAPPATSVPRPAHTVVVVLENHGYGQVIGSSSAPYLNQLAGSGALFTRSYAITHPSEPNYLALFSGSTHGVTSDTCPLSFSGPNLASELLAAGDTFTGYAEGLPHGGYTFCLDGEYARKHVPWTDFTNIPPSANQPFTRFPASFASLPTVSFVIPNLCSDMHDCGVSTGDSWLRAHLGGYVTWAKTHDSLLIVTWDEDDSSSLSNHIATIVVGQPVRPGRYAQRITHYSVLATIEAAYGLPRTGAAASARPMTGIWQP